MLPRICSSYVLYTFCLFFVFLLGYRLHCSRCCNYVRINIVKTVNFTFRSGTENNVYRLLNPSHLQCNSFVEGSDEAFAHYISEGRVVMKQDPQLSMECSDILKRIKGFSHVDNKDDTSFAIARNAYSDYFMQEVFVGMHYSPDNQFCFALDSKSSNVFKEKMRKMAQCLNNVQVVEKEYNFTSGGHFQDFAHFDCIQQLLKKPKWSYVLLLQNNDMVTKTKSEISQILRVMNGAQLVGSQHPFRMKNRFPYELVPNAKMGKIFKNESGRPLSQLFSGISFVHSLNEMFLSREFVAALDRELDMEYLLTIFNKKFYGVDEFLFQSLAFNAHLGLHGQTSKICYHPDNFGPVRYHIWSTEKNKVECRSKHKRHRICMMTVEYLREMAYRHELLANKIWPSSDFGAVLCMIEILKGRASLNWPMLGLSKYESLHQVQEMRLRKLGIFDPTNFKCPWEK